MYCGNSVTVKMVCCKRIVLCHLDLETDICYIIHMEQLGSITTREELETYITLTETEKNWFTHHNGTLPFQISRYYANLIDPDNPEDPLRRQVVPSTEEDSVEPAEVLDPLAEVTHSVFPRLIHRYTNRVAFLVTDTCVTYCRHCFRRRFTAGSCSAVSDKELLDIVDYLREHTEVREILLTGGDPLTLSDTNLIRIMSALRSARNDLVIRLCTRVVATYPFRISENLITQLRKFTSPALYVMTQFNHWKEITAESKTAVARFIDAGIPVMNQTVLLRKVNDDVDTLERLMNDLVAIRVKPYYLFQGDLVGGTSHLRVPLEHGIQLESQLRQRLSGLAMPVYAIDLPEGGGKVPLGTVYLKGKKRDGSWEFRTVGGETRSYPDPNELH